jgi:hypothetical protein
MMLLPGMMMPPPGQAFGDTALMHSRADAAESAAELSDEELLLTPTVVYGFSLGDKVWRACFYTFRLLAPLSSLRSSPCLFVIGLLHLLPRL